MRNAHGKMKNVPSVYSTIVSQCLGYIFYKPHIIERSDFTQRYRTMSSISVENLSPIGRVVYKLEDKMYNLDELIW